MCKLCVLYNTDYQHKLRRCNKSNNLVYVYICYMYTGPGEDLFCTQ